jgi:hypothetical protein
MRRSLALALIGCLFVFGAAPAQARYGDPIPNSWAGTVDTWLVAGDRVVGRSQVQVSPAPTLTMSMAAGGTRVLAWRVMNVERASAIVMTTDCQSGSGFGLRYFTPKGEDVSSDLTHHGYTQTSIEEGTFRTLYVHVHAKRTNASLSCVLRGAGGYGGFDKVLLEVRT